MTPREANFYVNEDRLPRLCAVALREIADRVEQGAVLHPTIRAFVHQGATVTIDDDPNHVTQYDITVQIPMEAVVAKGGTYGLA